MSVGGVDVLLTEEERQLRDTVRSYLDEVVAPLVVQHERDHTFPWQLLPDLYEFGYVRGMVPEHDGGYGISHGALAVLMEEAGRCWASLRTTLNVQGMVCHILSRLGTPDQKRRFLQPILEGSRFGWFALTEPDAGSDAANLRTVAERRGDTLVLNGRKTYITNALHADLGIVMARVREGGRDEGVTALLVDRQESPYSVRDIPHMPVRATTSCELLFEDCEVPAGNLLGEVGSGLGSAMSAINVGRLSMAMGAVGIAQACLEASIDYARTREQFGRPIGEFQLVQQMVVDIATATEGARLLGLKAARTLDAGLPGRYECSMAKYQCGEAANQAATLAVQVHGGAGLMEEYPVERYFRDAREATIPEGTSQIQVLQMGRALLGLSATRP
ncbi:MAG: acyl-CoA dehydrogenase family protein [Actinomycetota bacterium]